MIFDLTKTSVEHRLDDIDRAREGLAFIEQMWDMYVRYMFSHTYVPQKHEIVLYDERNAS